MDAYEKLADLKGLKGNKEQAMATAVAGALRGFCDQDAEFRQAVEQGGSFADCMMAVAKGVGNAISDLDAYKKAVQFYFPGALIEVKMTIDLVGEAAKENKAAAEPETGDVPGGGIVLNLEDFL